MTELKLFNKWNASGVKINDLGLQKYMAFDSTYIPKSYGRNITRLTRGKKHVVERLITKLMGPGHKGKKHTVSSGHCSGKYSTCYKIVEECFTAIEKKLGKNPIEVFATAIENGAPREEITTIEYGGARYPKAVECSPLRRIDITLRSMIQGAYGKSFNTRKAMSECLADEDIINTWATSSLTPQIAASLVPERYDEIYPMSVRPQAHDIITFWLFNTVVKSQLHNKINPFKDVIISGWALDPKGKKMSKSKGNVIEPQTMITKYSADALRFWAAGSKLGDDIPFQEKDLLTGHKFVNKIWNASKFVFLHLEGFEKGEVYSAFDKWLLAKLNKVIVSNTENFNKYDYNQVKLMTENFFWHTFCDDYLEIVKDRLYNPDVRGEKESNSAKQTLSWVLLDSLKMLAPILPHITEEIYQNGFKEKDSIHLTEWPKIWDVDESYLEKGDLAVEIISKVRQYKSEQKVSMKAPVKLILDKKDEETLLEFLDDLKAVTNAESLKFGEKFKIELKDKEV